MEARGRRCHRAWCAREDALVALAICGAGRAVDIGWQRHLAEALEELLGGCGQLDPPQLRLTRQHPDRSSCGLHLEPDANRFAGGELRQRLPRLQRTLEEDLHPPTGGLGAAEPRGDDTGVVDDEQIATAQILG